MRFFILLLLISACAGQQKNNNVFTEDTSYVQYAKGFKVSYNGNIKQVEITKPYQSATAGFTYWLVPDGTSVPTHGADVKIIPIPIRSIVCTSTTHIPLLDYLNETDALIGFPTTDYISSTKMRSRIDSGKVLDLGVDKGLNIELLTNLAPDVVMAYTMTGDYGQYKSIEDLGTPVVINAEYLEEHPLGRAEWIKFMALFFNKEAVADSVFRLIEQNYLQTKKIVDSAVTHSPSVMSGIVYGDAWFMPGGQNFAAKLLKDAGLHYLWADDATNGYLQVPFELVYEKANQADFWIGVGSFKTMLEIKNSDQRYTKFKAYTDKKVFTYDARQGAKGGSEFLELGYLRPDLILEDLVKIAHPQLLPDSTLFFHKRLE